MGRLTPAMLKQILRTFGSVLLVAIFSVFVFGQATPFTGRESETEIFVRVIGWVMLSGAALSHITTNIYAVWKGKSYDQLKESVSNYKELADSRLARLSDTLARNAILEREIERRDLSDEIEREKELRR